MICSHQKGTSDSFQAFTPTQMAAAIKPGTSAAIPPIAYAVYAAIAAFVGAAGPATSSSNDDIELLMEAACQCWALLRQWLLLVQQVPA